LHHIDAEGKVVRFEKINAPIYKLNVEGLSKGIYFIRLSNSKKLGVKKLIID